MKTPNVIIFITALTLATSTFAGTTKKRRYKKTKKSKFYKKKIMKRSFSSVTTDDLLDDLEVDHKSSFKLDLKKSLEQPVKEPSLKFAPEIGLEQVNYSSISTKSNSVSSDVNLDEPDRGVSIGLGIQYRLNDKISITTTPSLSLAKDEDSDTTSGFNRNIQTTTFNARISQSVNYSFYTDVFEVRPFVAATLGYSKDRTTYSNQNIATKQEIESKDTLTSRMFGIGIGSKFIHNESGVFLFAKYSLEKHFGFEYEALNNISTNAQQQYKDFIEQEDPTITAHSLTAGIGVEF